MLRNETTFSVSPQRQTTVAQLSLVSIETTRRVNLAIRELRREKSSCAHGAHGSLMLNVQFSGYILTVLVTYDIFKHPTSWRYIEDG